jgi:cytochrome c oxidase subunit 3
LEVRIDDSDNDDEERNHVSSIATTTSAIESQWIVPSRGHVGMLCLIAAESAIFIIFVVAYLFYLGKSLVGPMPKDVLDIPIFATICLLSSSLTIHLAVKALRNGKVRSFGLWWFVTMALGLIFLIETGREWYRLIFEKGLTISTNLFGTTYYSLVGLHAFHVTIGLICIATAMILTAFGKITQEHSDRADVFSLYWHFVDGVWVIVFTVVYIIGR